MSYSSDRSTTVPSDDFSGPGSLRVEDQPFALVPEWVIDADVSDAAFRVYSLLLRYGNTSGQRMEVVPGLVELEVAVPHLRPAWW